MGIYDSVFSEHDDPDRLAARRIEIKTAIARRSIQERRAADLTEVLRQVERDFARQQAERDTDVGAAEAKLSKLDEAAIAAMVAGDQPEDDSAARRKLNLSIAERDREFELAKQASVSQQRGLLKQISDLQKEIAEGAALEFQLSALAPLPLQAERKATHELRTLLLRLSSSVASKAEAVDTQLSDRKNHFVRHGRVAMELQRDNLRFQSAALGRFVSDLRDRADELDQQVREC